MKDSGPVNFSDAMITSDNIYFAIQALRVGSEYFEQGAADFAFGESLPIDYPTYNSQLSNLGLDNEILLADTGYGQGEILVSTLHMAFVYSTIATDGNMLMPILESTGDIKKVIWKKNVVRPEDILLLREVLLKVVEDPKGSGYDLNPISRRILGKIGTAELNRNTDQEETKENGWFVAMDAEEDSLIIAMMIEDVKDRGGSHFVVPIVKRAMEAVFSQIKQ